MDEGHAGYSGYVDDGCDVREFVRSFLHVVLLYKGGCCYCRAMSLVSMRVGVGVMVLYDTYLFL
jgi:hypothetical protein